LPRSKPLHSSALLFLFFVSGLSALVYEVVWARLLGYVTGNSVYSVATVLATFMGGLAIGAFWGGRRAPGLERPIRGYAFLEIGIGAAGLVVPFAIDALVPVYRFLAALTGAEPESAGLLLTRFLLSALVLLVPTTLMGMTLPYLTRAVANRLDRIGLTVGALYGVNTFGAFAGALIAGFAFIPLFGMLGATIAAAALNVVVAFAALAIDRAAAAPAEPAPGEARREEEPARREVAPAAGKKKKTHGKATKPVAASPASPAPAPAAPAAPAAEPARSAPSAAPVPVSRAASLLLVVAFGVAGAASMVDQIAWTRVFSLIVGPTTYAFTLMVSSFILGLALGGFLGSLIVDRLRDRLSAFATVEALVGVVCVVLVWFLGDLPYVLFRPLYLRAAGIGFGASQLLVFSILFLIVFVPTTLMGFAFPLVARAVTQDLRTAARSVGFAAAGNTLGAIVGSVAGGFALVPLLGLQKSLYAAAFLNGAAALLALVARATIRPLRLSAFAPVFVLPAFFLVLVVPSWDPNALSAGLYLYAAERGAQIEAGADLKKMFGAREQLFYREGVTTTVNVERDPRTDALFLRVTGKTDASTTSDMRTQLLLAHVPALLHPEPKEALVIGLGSGVTLGALLRHPSIERADCVEIAREVVEASAFFGPWNDDFRLDPRHRIVLEDARNYLLLNEKTFDLVASEPSNPWIAGIGTLFTREFFDLGRSRLRDGGLFCQWVSVTKMGLEDFRSVVRTFTDVFPDAALFSINWGVDYLLVGSKASVPPRFDWRRVAEAFADDEVFRHRNLLGLPAAEHVLLTYIARGEKLRRFAEGADLIRDDHNGLELSMARNLYRSVSKLGISEAVSLLLSDPSEIVDLSGLDADARKKLDRVLLDVAEAASLLYATTAASIDLSENRPDEEEVARRYEEIKRNLESVLEKLPGAFDAVESLSFFYRHEALQCINAQLVDDAAVAFRNAVRVKPGDRDSARALAEIQHMYAQNELASGRVKAATDLLVDAQTLDPRSGTVSQLLAECFGRQGLYREQVRELERARSLLPDDPGVLVALGEGYLRLNAEGRAVEMFERAVKLDPGAPRTHLLLGAVFQRLSKERGGTVDLSEKAIGHYVDALKLRPDYADAMNNLAVLYFDDGFASRAKAMAEKLLELHPDHAQRNPIRYLLARVNARLGDFDGAIRILGELLKEGIVDRARIEAEADFAPLKTHPGFEALFR